jgi:thymidylate kinase
MKRLVIVEGPDGGGKSTVIDGLGLAPRKFRALRAGVGATAADGTCSDQATEGWAGNRPAVRAYLDQVAAHLSEPIAFDRFHLSEIVYGPMLRAAAGVDALETLAINQTLEELRVPVIICLPPYEVTLQNVQQPGRERPAFQTEAFLLEAHHRWTLVRDALSRYQNVVIFDYTQMTRDSLNLNVEAARMI